MRQHQDQVSSRRRTGAFVSAGKKHRGGVTLAVKEINDAGGFKLGGKTSKFTL